MTTRPGLPPPRAAWARTGKQKNRYAEHRFLDKLCRPWANSSYDFCIMMNLWPLVYLALDAENEEEVVDMTTEFACGFWGCYVGYMEARPSLHSDEAQDVYKYILTHIPQLVAGWRARIYCYSSASIFNRSSSFRFAFFLARLISFFSSFASDPSGSSAIAMALPQIPSSN